MGRSLLFITLAKAFARRSLLVTQANSYAGRSFLSVAMTLGLTLLLSCGDDDTRGQDQVKPSVSFANAEGIYTVKEGRTLTIVPTVTNAKDPEYFWILDEDVVGRELSYEFVAPADGSAIHYYLTFRVEATNGSVEKEVRVDVLPLTPPVVALPVGEEGYITAIKGRQLQIRADVTNGAGALYKWEQDGAETEQTGQTYIFMQTEAGDYTLTVTVTNEDGQGRDEAIVRVIDVPAVSLYLEDMSVPLGRKAVIAPYVSFATPSTTYQWELDGQATGQRGQIFSFTPTTRGTHTVKVTATNEAGISSEVMTLTCVDEEGTHYRPAATGSSANASRVYEFLAAPGQYTNTGYAALTMEQANDYAAARLAEGGYVSLGGFGGRLVVGFDHSIENGSGPDLAIRGNALAGNSEPGVVWVMQDENGNGLPDDTWYELKGSETGKPETMQRYAITYFKPAEDTQAIRWTDSQGDSGTLAARGRNYPAWVAEESYTLRGTLLQPRNQDPSGQGSAWYNGEYDWGYADNLGSDYISGETHLDIDNAIYPDGTPVKLEYIDFVKVQNCVNAESGWLGEVSTEVFGLRDMGIGK